MKKTHLLVLPFLLVFMVACGPNPEKTEEEFPGNVPTEYEDTENTQRNTESEMKNTPAEEPTLSPQGQHEKEAMPVHLYADLSKDYDELKDKFEIADGWSNGSMFYCTWRRKNCTLDGVMKLTIDKDAQGTEAIPYSGAEFRSKEFYGYGYYEVSMKPIQHDGVVSSFFTYTGPSDHNPWDEIDIEFLGKDTTKVQFNYFTKGSGNHEYVHELGFDAAEDFHTYAFEWKKDSITWFVDGKEVYAANKNIPNTPGKIMMNVWPGTGVDSWLKVYDGTTPLSTEYRYFEYRSIEEAVE